MTTILTTKNNNNTHREDLQNIKINNLNNLLNENISIDHSIQHLKKKSQAIYCHHRSKSLIKSRSYNNQFHNQFPNESLSINKSKKMLNSNKNVWPFNQRNRENNIELEKYQIDNINEINQIIPHNSDIFLDQSKELLNKYEERSQPKDVSLMAMKIEKRICNKLSTLSYKNKPPTFETLNKDSNEEKNESNSTNKGFFKASDTNTEFKFKLKQPEKGTDSLPNAPRSKNHDYKLKYYEMKGIEYKNYSNNYLTLDKSENIKSKKNRYSHNIDTKNRVTLELVIEKLHHEKIKPNDYTKNNIDNTILKDILSEVLGENNKGQVKMIKQKIKDPNLMHLKNNNNATYEELPYLQNQRWSAKVNNVYSSSNENINRSIVTNADINPSNRSIIGLFANNQKERKQSLERIKGKKRHSLNNFENQVREYYQINHKFNYCPLILEPHPKEAKLNNCSSTSSLIPEIHSYVFTLDTNPTITTIESHNNFLCKET